MKNAWISHLNLEKNELWKFDIFTWKFMKAHDKYLNLTSELGKERTLKIWYFSWKFMKAHEKYFNLTSELVKERTLKVWDFYMKIHESAWKILESHIWTWKRVNFESLIFFYENSWKRMNYTWISHLNLEKCEFLKFDIFSWKFMKAHE